MSMMIKGYMVRFSLNAIAGLALFGVVSGAQAQDDVEQGKQLYESRCALCHQLPEPDMLKEKQWRRSLLTMQKRMQSAGMPPLNDAEFEQMMAYLATQARK